jgi:hypothetical protein
MINNEQRPILIEDNNLSRAWSRAFLHTIDHAGTEIAPLLLSLGGFDQDGIPREDYEVRDALDSALRSKNFWPIDVVAFTIFPQDYWEMSGNDRQSFYATCIDAAPRLQAMNRHANGRGLYFDRLMNYGTGPLNGNQLEWIISQYTRRDGVRRSLLQASTFDPGRDHVASAQLGFPCLQQISFVPSDSGLHVNAFYATQQLFDKAYGNYLGLVQLGAFMAHAMNLRLARLNVFSGVAKLERISKRDKGIEPLITAARRCADPYDTSGILNTGYSGRASSVSTPGKEIR